MDFSQMLTQHILTQADITVAGIRQPRAEASEFGVIEVDPSRPEQIQRFREKPSDPVGLPDAPDQVLVSMGNYIATRKQLEEAIQLDHANPNSKNDMGGDIVPYFTERKTSFVYDFSQNQVPGASPEDQNYWRDVGSIDAYFEANLDLVAVVPKFNMYNKLWPIHTNYPGLPPAKFLFNEDNRIGYAKNSLVGPGSIISGAKVSHSVISTEVRIGSYSEIQYSIILPNASIDRSVKLNRVIVDKYAKIPAGLEIGFDPELDRSRGFTVTDSGITVVPRFWSEPVNA
jgi:glucose-1-phosphate adenylyltransferase